MEFDNSRDEANQQLIEISRDAVNKMCEGMLNVMFKRFQTRLTDDREELRMYEWSGMQEGTSVNLYVSPTFVDAPMTHETYNKALSLKLEFTHAKDGDESLEGDVVYVFMPVPRADYVYPEPLEADDSTETTESLDTILAQIEDDSVEFEPFRHDKNSQIDDGDRPTEMYFHYIPREDKGLPSARYVMQRDIDDPKYRYRLFRYTIPYDGDPMHVSNSFDIGLERLDERIHEDTEDTMKLLRQLANFTEVYQKSVNPHPPIA